MTTIIDDFQAILEKFAADLTATYDLHASFSPEDQLKTPVVALLKDAAQVLKLTVDTVTEVHVDDLAGRPDIGVFVQSLIAGYVELKAPDKGADPDKLKGADQTQWKKFQNLPNLIYTNGSEWGLYRNGARIGKTIRLSGDVTRDGASAVEPNDARALLELLRDFFHWEPIVPATPRALAELLAPICRLLREDVLAALQNPDSNLSALAADWRKYLFPDADDKQFADAYAQTLTYALLLARFSGSDDLSLSQAVKTIRTGHRLLADTLKILGDDRAREAIAVPVSLLERVIAAIDTPALTQKSKGDPWLYFYEDYLAAYDPQMRKDRGVYYTPVPVVQTQVRLVAHLLAEHFDADFSFVDPQVVTLDPAAGTGTYVLAAIEHGLDQVAKVKGPGMRARYASTIAENMHAFEVLVGPYSVAHLRLTQQILSEGGKVPDEGVHVYLTDTLESPNAQPPRLPYWYQPLGEEHRRAQKVKAETPILVCIGNPPYDRQQRAAESQEKRKGGWVRFGDTDTGEDALLRSFLDPLTESGLGVHAKNLYNDYVYFWRWALWKVFESKSGPGIVSFITASSYVRGPGFAGMRKVMRETFDDLWIIDLEGDNLGARKTDNVFAIQTPVAIAVGVRYGAPHPETPANVYYTRLDGSQEEKLARLAAATGFQDFTWRPCLSGWLDLFLPGGEGAYWDWPLLTDLFPWQVNGVMFGRTWPIAASVNVLQQRWQTLMKSGDRKLLFKNSPTGRKVHNVTKALPPDDVQLSSVQSLPAATSSPPTRRYSFRSFDRQWIFADSRFIDRPSPDLWSVHSPEQVYLTSFLTEVLGEGPAAVATHLVPDKHHFRGSFGGAHVVPLWRDASATDANLTAGVLDVLRQTYGQPVTAEDVFAYGYTLLATPDYVKRFWDELTIPGPRIPVTKDATLFARVVTLGRRLLWLHTYAERFTPPGHKPGKLPSGQARCKVGVPATPEDYPEDFGYDYANHELRVGKGVFVEVRSQVWEFSVSGLEVVKSWLGYRMRNRSGRSSSPLDAIRPQVWEFDEELLDLLWVLDHTVDLLPDVATAFEAVLAGELFAASDFPQPTDAERKGPKGVNTEMPLFDLIGFEEEPIDDEE